jgi:hypothetical protein
MCFSSYSTRSSQEDQCDKCDLSGADCVILGTAGACQRCRDKKVKCSLLAAGAKTRKISVQTRTAQSKGKQREGDSSLEKEAEASGLAPSPLATLSRLRDLSVVRAPASITPPDLPATVVVPELFEDPDTSFQATAATVAPWRAVAAHAPQRNSASSSRRRFPPFGTPSFTPPSTTGSLKASGDTQSRITALEDGVSGLWEQVMAIRDWITDVDSQVKLANSMR